MQGSYGGATRRGRGVFRISAAVGVAAAVVFAWAAPARPEELRHGQDYALLSLDGQTVKWGESRLGAPAHVRFAFLDTEVARPEGINCRAMRPFPSRLGARQVPRHAVDAAFRAAFRIWQSTTAVIFEEVADQAAADVVIGIQTVPTGIAFADVQPQALSGSAIAPIRRAAICLNPEKVWKSGFDGDLKTYDLRYVALHEIGHILGLDHVWTKQGTVMAVDYTERHSLPQAGDIAGARVLYGAPAVMNTAAASSRKNGGIGDPAVSSTGEVPVNVVR